MEYRTVDGAYTREDFIKSRVNKKIVVAFFKRYSHDREEEAYTYCNFIEILAIASRYSLLMLRNDIECGLALKSNWYCYFQATNNH